MSDKETARVVGEPTDLIGSVGARVEIAMKWREIATQDELIRLSGVPSPIVSDLLAGKKWTTRSAWIKASARYVLALARALQVDPWWLLFGAEPEGDPRVQHAMTLARNAGVSDEAIATTRSANAFRGEQLTTIDWLRLALAEDALLNRNKSK